MAIGDYSTTRDNNAAIVPGLLRAGDTEQTEQQVINAIRQLMADLATYNSNVIQPLIDGLIASTLLTLFTVSGTFTPNAKMLFCDVWGWGGGGAGGGVPATAAGQSGAGAGGHAGAKSQSRFTAAQIGASQAVTIGAGGVGTNGAGPAGSATTLGALLSAAGGLGGPTTGATAALIPTDLNIAVQSATGNVRGWTTTGERGLVFSAARAWGGSGGANEWGGSGRGVLTAGSASAGGNGSANTGAGGGGGAINNLATGGGVNGGNGGSGLLIVREYLKL